ncbi:hypothetical protein M419DRAFT_116947 [Trichoderma reesei RUT C-30]|uniref:Uncharacterized protein n=1 Tax=Hypocrea jecorina (strain ATCC 56765 / BCRC 32924 / NRRL 11460 / Rut C-30) TaxID=1344414 RepID=A0A024SML5_HYPJR|nr:hypothetical protein M419DRAFT_116947 [Trichoderma reesei RUT C-30]
MEVLRELGNEWYVSSIGSGVFIMCWTPSRRLGVVDSDTPVSWTFCIFVFGSSAWRGVGGTGDLLNI